MNLAYRDALKLIVLVRVVKSLIGWLDPILTDRIIEGILYSGVLAWFWISEILILINVVPNFHYLN